jgi:hypothetical protein
VTLKVGKKGLETSKKVVADKGNSNGRLLSSYCTSIQFPNSAESWVYHALLYQSNLTPRNNWKYNLLLITTTLEKAAGLGVQELVAISIQQTDHIRFSKVYAYRSIAQFMAAYATTKGGTT